MIDYDKLRKAVELANEAKLRLTVQVLNTDDALIFDGRTFSALFINNKESLTFHNLDELIAELQELTQPRAKYEKGQMVWVISWGDVKEVEVIEIYWDSDLQDYRLSLDTKAGKMSIGQSLVYPTKQSLIEAQIEYWQSLPEIQPRPEGVTGPIDYYPAFEGPVKGFNEKIRKATCCGKEWSYTVTDWSNAKCHLCGQHLCENHSEDKLEKVECQHESDGGYHCTTEGLIIERLNKCLKCGEFYR